VPFDGLGLPEELTDLRVEFMWGRPREFRFPRALKTLRIDRSATGLEGLLLPKSLEHLTLGSQFPQENLVRVHIQPELKTLTVYPRNKHTVAPMLQTILSAHPHLKITIMFFNDRGMYFSSPFPSV